MEKFLAVCALIVSGMPVAAEKLNSGDVFYCVSNAFAQSGDQTDWKLEAYAAEKFKIQITQEKVNFSHDGWFKNFNMNVNFFADHKLKAIKDDYTITLHLRNKSEAKFTLTENSAYGFMAITANCDRF